MSEAKHEASKGGRDLNRVELRGRLSADPDLRYSPQGLAITKFRLAVNSSKSADFFDVTAFDELAESIAQNCVKGLAVHVAGRLSTSRWETKDGAKRSKLQVIASAVETLV